MASDYINEQNPGMPDSVVPGQTEFGAGFTELPAWGPPLGMSGMPEMPGMTGMPVSYTHLWDC